MVLISLDEMDGFFSRGWTAGREDNVPKQEMRRKAGKLRLGWRVLQLQRMGSSGSSHCHSR